MNHLYDIITEISDDKLYKISHETDLIVDLRYDSLKIIQLISEIEEAFQIEFDIDDIDIDLLRSVKTLNQIIQNRIHNKNQVDDKDHNE